MFDDNLRYITHKYNIQYDNFTHICYINLFSLLIEGSIVTDRPPKMFSFTVQDYTGMRKSIRIFIQIITINMNNIILKNSPSSNCKPTVTFTSFLFRSVSTISNVALLGKLENLMVLVRSIIFL